MTRCLSEGGGRRSEDSEWLEAFSQIDDLGCGAITCEDLSAALQEQSNPRLAEAAGSTEELFQQISGGDADFDDFVTATRWAKMRPLLPPKVRQAVLDSLALASGVASGEALAQTTLEAPEVVALLESFGVPDDE